MPVAAMPAMPAVIVVVRVAFMAAALLAGVPGEAMGRAAGSGRIAGRSARPSPCLRREREETPKAVESRENCPVRPACWSG
ncbi:hypothetical protein GCM10022268_01230 [Sphingomonas cynarae]|uniref:Secreted protein n=1 Tax=Sphingomonas cynarae TaxID=930197 RepID=A0ABP7CPR3_9SPHN